MIASFGLFSLFLLHGTVCAVAAIFVFVFVPETKDKTLTELCGIYKDKSGKESQDGDSAYMSEIEAWSQSSHLSPV